MTAIDVSFQGLSPFNAIFASQPVRTSNWHVEARNSLFYVLFLDFTTGHTPGSLVDFTGGTISGSFVFYGPTGVPVYIINGGSITAPAGVPDGGSTVSLLGFAALGLVALRRKLRC